MKLLVLATLAGIISNTLRGTEVVTTDICVYGGTSGGVIAAVQAARLGKSVSLAVFDTHLGGLTSGGLGYTDLGNTNSISGLAREFYRRVGQAYGQTEQFTFEPHVARQIFEAWLEESGIAPRFNQRLAAVVKVGHQITEITMEDGTVYRAKMFIDATYEGDLMAMAGVSFTFGREGTNVYGESLNGIRAKTSPPHQFTVNVDPYIIPGNPASGLLPFVQSEDGGAPGNGDHRIQAYNYRLCFTQDITNKLPHIVPPNYDPARYELLGRLLDARAAAGDTLTISSFFNVKHLPNGKTDMNNNGPISTDFIGMNYTYPTNTYDARAQMQQEHLEYIQGLIYYLATSPRSPATLRAEIQSWGPCKDEWPDTGGYSPAIYVREARRMVSDYVMTQANCQGTRTAMDSICLGSYNMDSHNCQRLVQNGYVRNEGDVQVASPKPYPISYRSIVPRVGECENLLVTFAISASHIAFGSTRTEPVFMMISQSAAVAAALAIDEAVAVQQIDYPQLALQLAANHQILNWGASSDEFLTNGDFETLPVMADSSTNTFPFWRELTNGAAATAAPVAIAGGHSALLVHTAGGDLHQDIADIGGWKADWIFDGDFACSNPGGNGARSFQLNLYHGTGQNINARVVDAEPDGIGDLQLYNGSAFVTVLSNAIIFSSSPNDLSENHIKIVGRYYATNSPNYDVIVVNSLLQTNRALNQRLWQGAPPPVNSVNTRLTQVRFDCQNLAVGSFTIVDNLTLTISDARSTALTPFRITDIAKSETGIVLTWQSSSGHVYQVQSKNALSDTNWANVLSGITATGMATSLTNIATTPAQFYRVLGQ